MARVSWRPARAYLTMNSRSFATSHSAPKTPLSLGHGAILKKAHTLKTCERQNPVAVISGWMGAKPQQLDKYAQFYRDRGWDTVSFAAGPKDVIFPKTAVARMEEIWKQVDSITEKNTPVVFHGFSVSGFLWGVSLRLMFSSDRPSRLPLTLRDKIRGQIFDSPPDIDNIPKGVAASLGLNGISENIVRSAMTCYQHLSRKGAGVLHRESSAAFHANPCMAPSLWFYSHTDAVAPAEDCDAMCDRWSALGIDTHRVVWEESPHIMHGRYDPDRYFSELDQFLNAVGVDDTAVARNFAPHIEEPYHEEQCEAMAM